MFQATRESRMCATGKIFERAELEAICVWWDYRNEGPSTEISGWSRSNGQGESSSGVCNISRCRWQHTWGFYSHPRKSHYLIQSINTCTVLRPSVLVSTVGHTIIQINNKSWSSYTSTCPFFLLHQKQNLKTIMHPPRPLWQTILGREFFENKYCDLWIWKA